MRVLMAIIGCCIALGARGQPQYHMVPSNDPANPYRIEQIVPPDVRTTDSFDDAIQQLRSLEGIDPGATVQIMEDPANPKPAALCSLPSGEIQACANAGVTVQ